MALRTTVIFVVCLWAVLARPASADCPGMCGAQAWNAGLLRAACLLRA